MVNLLRNRSVEPTRNNLRGITLGPTRAVVAAALLATSLPAQPAVAEPYLESAGVAALVAVPAASTYLGLRSRLAARDRPPRWVRPSALDRWAARHLAPAPGPGPGNFMDTERANTLNKLFLGAAVGWLDGRHPRDDAFRDVLQGQLLYWSGLLTLQGVQASVKSAVGRQRPLPALWPEVAARRAHADPGHDRSSFWSGHTSGAFYGATFLNLRLRSVLRRELSAADYRGWRWASPLVLYGWAAWVGYSRIHAHQHYLTDVLAGAAAGYAFAAVFAALDPRPPDGAADDGRPTPLAAIMLRF